MPRISAFDRQQLDALAARQHGVVAREQALGCGMTRRVVEYRVRSSGPWSVLLPGVYLTHTGRPDDAAREMAALLYAGSQSVLTGVAALRRHGLSVSRSGGPGRSQADVVDVLVPLASRRVEVAPYHVAADPLSAPRGGRRDPPGASRRSQTTTNSHNPL
jgi:hypothetical protein